MVTVLTDLAGEGKFMKKVVVYTMSRCPYCESAKALLKQRGIPFQEILVPEEDDAQWDALYERSKMRTMPQIFADESLIGGFTELAALDKRDHLASLK
jgi:glutaredoxin 3